MLSEPPADGLGGSLGPPDKWPWGFGVEVF